MPYTSNAAGVANTLSYWLAPGKFEINRVAADNSDIGFSPALQFRYVIVPGGLALSVEKHVNLKDYQAVKRYFRIPD